MKPMLKIELERAFTSISFKIAVIIGMAVSVLEFVRKVIPAAANPVMYFKPYADNMPLNVHNMWLAGSRDMYYEVFCVYCQFLWCFRMRQLIIRTFIEG